MTCSTDAGAAPPSLPVNPHRLGVLSARRRSDRVLGRSEGGPEGLGALLAAVLSWCLFSPAAADLLVQVNKLTSTKTQLPYEWYSLPFCRPEEILSKAENLGEVMRGDKIENSLYEIKMNMEESCKVLCKKAYMDSDMKEFKSKVARCSRMLSAAREGSCQ